MDNRVRSKLEKIYCTPRGDVNKLAQEAKVSKRNFARELLTKQALWQVYLPYHKYIPRTTSANALLEKPNEVY